MLEFVAQNLKKNEASALSRAHKLVRRCIRKAQTTKLQLYSPLCLLYVRLGICAMSCPDCGVWLTATEVVMPALDRYAIHQSKQLSCVACMLTLQLTKQQQQR